MFVIKKKMMSPIKVFTVRKWSCGKAMFLYLSVSHSVHRGRGVSASGSVGCLPLVRSVCVCLWVRGVGVHPQDRHGVSASGSGGCSPLGRHISEADTPPGQTPLQADTHRQTPHPRQETATEACGTHPTGIDSCFFGEGGDFQFPETVRCKYEWQLRKFFKFTFDCSEWSSLSVPCSYFPDLYCAGNTSMDCRII